MSWRLPVAVSRARCFRGPDADPAPGLHAYLTRPLRAGGPDPMSAASAFFVQFPHPGAEHHPAGPVMGWNLADHRRKFLICAGRYLDADDRVQEAELMFWGEWEPPSAIHARWPPDDHLPRALHRPYWAEPTRDGFRQNTDPWVFGDRMLYSNCKQTTRAGRHPTAMQKLTRGSVVCFGSAVGGQFCADTVLVVASAERWIPGEVQDLGAGNAFQACTAAAVATGSCGYAQASLTLYRGATIDDPVDGMYSFVPARPAGAPRPRFARPPIRLPGLINPASTQSARGSSRPQPARAVRNAWEAIQHQVLAAGLVLAVHLETPPKHIEDTAIPASDRTRC